MIAHNIELPEIRVGERLLFHDAGAYTNEYAAAFNGFPIPEVISLNVGLRVTDINVISLSA